MNKFVLTRQEIEAQEAAVLAPYAALSGNSRGRVYSRPEHPLRTAYQRDRDRIVHSAAFRRMEYKTQVFIPQESDHFRNRLTHTIEVAQISRTMARSLGLNEDLAESIALVHDLGHTPFGHAGEDALNDLLKEAGGFNHNRQSLRVVDVLEKRYPDHPGLNLTYEVREGIVKHETKIKIELPEFNPDEQPTLEASLVDIADEITYNAHDLDDGLSSGFLTLDDLKNGNLYSVLELNEADINEDFDKQRYALVRGLINAMVSDVLEETGNRLNQNKISSFESLRSCKNKLCGYSEEMLKTAVVIKEFLDERLYNHPRMKAHSEHAEKTISSMFELFMKKPEHLPDNFLKMLSSEKKEIVIADYIAGMTDRFAEKTRQQLLGD